MQIGINSGLSKDNMSAMQELVKAGVTVYRSGVAWDQVEEGYAENLPWHWDIPDREVSLCRQAGVKWAPFLMGPRWDLSWQYNLIRGNTLRLLDLTGWRKFVKELVLRYQDDIAFCEIWNDVAHPEASMWEAPLSAFTPFVKQITGWIKEVCPSMKVCAGSSFDPGLVNYRVMIDSGLADSGIDMISIFCYPLNCALKDVQNAIEPMMLKLRTLSKLPIVVSEIGFPSDVLPTRLASSLIPGGVCALTQTEQAQFLSKALSVMHQSGVECAFVHSLCDIKRHLFWGDYCGLLNSDNTKKESFVSLQNHLLSVHKNKSTTSSINGKLKMVNSKKLR